MTNLPVTGIFTITCPYHKKGKKWAAGLHTGIDIVSLNKRVYGTCDGYVYKIIYGDKYYGNYIVIRSNEDSTFHWFCHLQTIFVKIGQLVSRGTVLRNNGKNRKLHRCSFTL